MIGFVFADEKEVKTFHKNVLIQQKFPTVRPSTFYISHNPSQQYSKTF
jgi:hypothetical protein